MSKLCEIAVVGAACRFPGGASSPEAFWDLLEQGRDAVTEIPDDRWDRAQFLHPDPRQPGRTYSAAAGTLGDVSGFDAAFFGIAPREAEQMDPQQRLLLEMAWEAFERAGIPPERAAAGTCGVYVGVSSTDYGDLRQNDPATANAYFMLGSTLSIVANRVSYLFDLHGPSMAIDTACSSSLVALDQAVQALLDGRVDAALVGGIHLLLSPYPYIGFSKASMLSDYGRCRAFARVAKGYVRAEGGGAVLLKPLAAAKRDGDPILAVIRGSGSNNDGRTQGIALPSSERQESLLKEVYGRFGLDPRDLVYVEAHGTGTAVGDPAEAGSIGRALAAGRADGDPLPIGSVKTNIGHLEPASGMAGLFKALGVLRRGRIPPSLHAAELNEAIPFAELGIEVVRALRPIRPAAGVAPLVGVNSFGFGGANAHVVLAAYAEEAVSAAAPAETPLPLVLSARAEPALRAAAGDLSCWLRAEPDGYLADAGYSLARRRSHHGQRLVLRSRDRREAAALLERYADGERLDQAVDGQVLPQPAKVAFVFSGNGAQWVGMGAQLLAEDPVFAATLRQVDALIRARAGWSVIDELRREARYSRLEATEYAQPSLFAVQAGLVAALAARGLRAEGTVGHSVGEVAAAHAAGCLDLAQAVEVILQRSAGQGRTRGRGRMAATDIDRARAEAEVAASDGRIELAAVNSPQAVTLSGELDALAELGSRLADEGVAYRLLDLDYAFHNRVLDPLEGELREGLAGLSPSPAAVPFFSTVTGARADDLPLDAGYWWRNMRQPVQFEAAVAAMIAEGYNLFVEIGPHPILQAYVRHNLRAAGATGQPLAVMLRQNAGAARLLQAVDQAFVLGAALDWARVYPAGRVAPLPTYPWQRERFWRPLSNEAAGPLYLRGEGTLLGARVAPEMTVWQSQLDTLRFPFLADHVVGGSAIFPAAGYAELLLEAGVALFGEVALELDTLQILRPLVLEENPSRSVRVTYVAEGGTARIEARARLSDDAWTLHAMARLLPAPAAALPLALEAPKGGRRHDAAAHYATAAALGLDYGPAFRTVSSVVTKGRIAQAELVLPEAAPGGFALHPGLFDGALQSLFSLVQALDGEADPATYLPHQMGRLLLHAPGGLPTTARLRLTRRNPRSLVADILLLDATGAPVASCGGLRLARAQLGRQRARQRLFDYSFVPLPDVAARPLPTPRELLALAPTDGEGSRPLLDRVALELTREADAPALWRAHLARHPEHQAELLALGRAWLRLDAGGLPPDGDAALLLAAPALQAPDAALEALVRGLLDRLPAGRALRLLDLSPLPALPERLRRSLEDPRLQVTALVPTGQGATADGSLRVLEQNPESLAGSLPEQGFDLVLLRHPERWGDSTDLAAALRSLRAEHLVVCGLAPAPWLDLVFGERAPADGGSALRRALAAAGFRDVERRAGAETLFLSARWPAPANQAAAVAPSATPSGRLWLLAAGDEGPEAELAASLAAELAERGERFRLVQPGPAFDQDELLTLLPFDAPEAWSDFWKALAGEEALSLVYLGGLADERAATAELALRAGWPLIAAIQGLKGAGVSVEPALTLVTAGVAGAALQGLGRVLANERPGLPLRFVELDAPAVDLALRLASELLAPTDDDLVLGRDHRLARRIRPLPPVEPQGEALRLSAAAGTLDDLAWEPVARRAPGRGEVEVRVRAAGLNFRDVMYGMGLLSDEAVEQGFAGATLGMEAAGEIVGVGAGVTAFAVGDPVFFFGPACFSAYVTVRTTAVARKPATLDDAAAATIPVAFFTVLYALESLARLKRGERLLIHGAAGGVGLAAIQVARHIGAEVFATVGSPEKRDLVRLLGVAEDHILDSRSLDFAEQIPALTGGRGLDVVLNSLAGEAMHRSLALLRPFGRFVELGKRDFFANSRLGLRPFRNNISYFGVDADQLLVEKPALAGRLFRRIGTLFDAGALSPLPYRLFPAARVVEAFRLMQQSRHVGKIVVTPPAPSGVPARVAPRGAHLVTGGTRGFGFATARWLASRGARHLVLLGRGGTPEAPDEVEALRRAGVRVDLRACDVTDAAALRDLVAGLAADGIPIRGAVHAATVYDDTTLDGLTAERLAGVLRTKLGGAESLLAALSGQPLDYLLFYSSITTLLGNPGQANYVAANLALEALAVEARRRGLPALTVGWGAIADAGYLTRRADVRDALEGKLGVAALGQAQALAELGPWLGRDRSTLFVAELDWKRLRGSLPTLAAGRFRDVAGGSAAAESEAAADIGALLWGLGPDEVLDLVKDLLAEQVGQVLRLAPDRIDRDRAIAELGMDSLMALELGLLVEERFGYQPPAMLIGEGISIARLAERIRDHLLARRAAPDSADADAVAKIAVLHAEALDEEAAAEIRRQVGSSGGQGGRQLIS